MNTTKRKFNALLNGLGTKPSTTKEVNNGSNLTFTPDESVESIAKKRRVSTSKSLLDRNDSPFRSLRLSTDFAAAMKDKKTILSTSITANDATQATEAPKYTPWDRKAFLKRLKSFSNLTDWTPKPSRVNEVEWAKRGWVCQRNERVRCCLCNVEILVKLNQKEVNGKEVPVYVAANIEQALVDKYVELIVTSHDENCLWRKRGCDDSIFKLPLNQAAATLQMLRARYDELCIGKDNLPYFFNLRTPLDFDVDLILSYLPQNFFGLQPKESKATLVEINKVAFIMALFGWQGHAHERLGVQLDSVSCSTCFRVLGLWLFKSKKVNEVGEELEGPIMNVLDTVKEHREYCPWKNPASQNGGKIIVRPEDLAMAGWQVILRVLKNDCQLRQSGAKHQEQPLTSGNAIASASRSIFGGDLDDDAQRKTRDEKDKERWVRLRKIKSLFDAKAGKKLQRPGEESKPKK